MADSLSVLESALDLAAKEGNVAVAQNIASEMARILRQRGEGGLPPPVKLGAENLPQSMKEALPQFGTAGQALGGVGSAASLAGQGLAGIVGMDSPRVTAENEALRSASPATKMGNMVGNAAMVAPLPAAAASRTLAAIPATRNVGLAAQGSRLATIADTSATAGLLNAAIQPGTGGERLQTGLLGASVAPIAPIFMGAGQGIRRSTTGQGKMLGVGERLLDEFGGGRPEELIASLKKTQSPISGVRLTAAGASDNANLAALETGSRVRAAGEWMPFDEANANARWQALMDRAGTEAERSGLRAARDAMTGGLRSESMGIAEGTINLSRGEFAKPIYETLERLSTGELRPNPQVQKLVSYVRGQLDEQLSPQQLYTVRKVLTGDIKGGMSDELSNAAKSARRETMGLVENIDAALDKMSGNTWGDYLKSYRSASKDINSKQALQDVIDGLQKGWGSGTVPPVMGTKPGPHQFGRMVEGETKREFGSKTADLLTPEDRLFIDNLQRDLARAQKGMSAQATIGSPTASFLANAGKARGIEQTILEQGMNRIIPLSGTATGAVAGKMGASSSAEAQRLMVQALQNPEIMANLLNDAWIARTLFGGSARVGAGAGSAASHSGLLGQ